MKILLVLICVFIFSNSFAQTDSSGIGVVIHKDPRADLLVKKQASINTATKKSVGRTMRGYRLMVLNTNKREDAIAAKTKVYTYFPELKAYLIYLGILKQEMRRKNTEKKCPLFFQKAFLL
jgi:hypothetical protein